MEQEWVETKIELEGKTVVHRYGMWPKQKQFHSTRKRYVLFGGARGPGKSHALNQHGFRAMLRWPGILVLLARRDLKDLKETTLREWRNVVPPEMYDPKYGGQWHQGDSYFRFPNGSTLMYSEFKDWESKKSLTAGLVLFDELNEIDEEGFINIEPVLRWTTGEGVCTYPECKELGEEFVRDHPIHPFYQIVSATNPSPGWVKDRFWLPWKEGRERKNHAFIPATAFDNPSLPPDFIPNLLEHNNATWVQNYIYGDWSSFENMVYPGFNRGLHVWKGPIPFDDFLFIEGGIDYGGTGETSHKTCAYLTGFTRWGTYITFAEYSKQGGAAADLFEWITRMTRLFKVRRWVADGSQPRANQLIRNAGINVQDAPRYKGAVKDGINLITRLLKPNPTGRPGIYITNDCSWLMSGIETYQLDPETGEPKKNQEDDEVDAWRYNIMAITNTGPVVQSENYTVRTTRSGVPSASKHLEAFRAEKRDRLRNALRIEGG